MPNRNIHTTKRGDKWANVISGNSRASGLYDTQKEAIQAAIPRAKKDGLEHVIHGKDNKIREKNSYGNDPRNIKG
ncbi:DUF2188 domain-containing protein [Paenibacillus radicis (ex Xue et al. 2023)]|uniref:DUF2188 domain-containing protein n=1 Tax=Paenibacillus radicis (ex Xue et al. 2023) TaxID=2972489 RepID=A0ABT1YL59_9BACL|nr:DUF2188 domain-containing protein [Paenibacillus radicis (ex Xue et al. 2023)]MCR8633922.1 DUF2188 domain-containing protein [Paenibacillus radicis (ex Xue et al. 2023)]